MPHPSMNTGQYIYPAESSTSQIIMPEVPSTSEQEHSASTLALISLTQDITALLSLSVEATASLVHDWFRSSLSTIGLGTPHSPRQVKTAIKGQGRGETGRGLAVVVIGAAERTSIFIHIN